MTDMLPVDEEKQALDRIARTPDGLLLHRYLRRVLETVVDVVDDGTLRAHTGRRSLARDLMVLMASGIEGSSGRTDLSDQPVLRQPAVAVGRPGTRAEQRRALWAAERNAESGTVIDDKPA